MSNETRPPRKKRPISLRRQIAAVREMRKCLHFSYRQRLVEEPAVRTVAELDAAIETLKLSKAR